MATPAIAPPGAYVYVTNPIDKSNEINPYNLKGRFAHLLENQSAIRSSNLSPDQIFFELKFNQFLKAWNNETLFESNPEKILNNPNLRSIAQMGMRALPLILSSLNKRTVFLVFILPEIVGFNIVKKEENLLRQAQMWQDWGKKHI